jgi:hypothetical protein
MEGLRPGGGPHQGDCRSSAGATSAVSTRPFRAARLRKKPA